MIQLAGSIIGIALLLIIGAVLVYAEASPFAKTRDKLLLILLNSTGVGMIILAIYFAALIVMQINYLPMPGMIILLATCLIFWLLTCGKHILRLVNGNH